MSRRSLWIHTVFCVVALGLAWWSAHRVKEQKGGPSSVTLLDAGAGDVTTITYRWDKGETKTTMSGKGALRMATVAITQQVGEQEDKETVTGAKIVHTAVAALEPLKTKRTLGPVDGERLKAMGLDAPVRTVVVESKKGTLELELGESSYGAQGRYARVKGKADVHLIDAAIASGLEGGVETLLEKRAITVELEQIEGYSVQAGGKSLALVHMEKEQPSTRYLATKDEPSRKREAAGKVLTTLRNLRGSKLASADTAAGATVLQFVVATKDGNQTATLVEKSDGEGFLLRAHERLYDVTSTTVRELQDDVDAALAE